MSGGGVGAGLESGQRGQSAGGGGRMSAGGAWAGAGGFGGWGGGGRVREDEVSYVCRGYFFRSVVRNSTTESSVLKLVVLILVC